MILRCVIMGFLGSAGESTMTLHVQDAPSEDMTTDSLLI
jgi:hypothetical protein